MYEDKHTIEGDTEGWEGWPDFGAGIPAVDFVTKPQKYVQKAKNVGIYLRENCPVAPAVKWIPSV